MTYCHDIHLLYYPNLDFLRVREDNSHKHIYRCKKQKLDILEQTGAHGHTFYESRSLLSVLWAPEILNEDVTSQGGEA